jgi:enamine deaminase RidA (YjgF/YER057c/UK114 family)
MGKKIIKDYGDFILYINFIGYDEVFITASIEKRTADSITTCYKIYQKIVDFLNQGNLQIVYERLFGDLQIQDKVLQARVENFKELIYVNELPVTYIEGKPCWGDGFAGLHIRAIKSNEARDNVWTIYDGNIPCGRGWKRNNLKYIILQNIHGNIDKNCSREEQTSQMFEYAEKLLRTQGAAYQNVIRTWIFISNILEWYDEFNRVRNRLYRKFNLIPDAYSENDINTIYLPASTGIQGENNFGAAAIMDLYAIIPENNSNVKIASTTGVKQQSAFHYGSAFSRAISICEADNMQILVSGTAAIDDIGKSVHYDNTKAQIHFTLDVVNGLIQNKGAKFEDIFDATIYLKRPEDITIYQEIKNKYGINNIPSICVLADVCRKELLFELDAFVVLNNKKFKRQL